MSRLQNYLETGITNSAVPPGPSLVPTAKLPLATPHPYFVNKFFVFFSLQVWLRCKILKTKELSAK
jgi:hypothetical protein